VLAAATPSCFGDPVIVDETLERLDVTCISAGDIVGIGIHTGNALRGYEIGRLARQQGAFVVFGGVHATLFPNEAHELGGAHAVVKGDGDTVWAGVLEDLQKSFTERCVCSGTDRSFCISVCTLGLIAAQSIHVGFRTDRKRMSQALLVLLCMANRRSTSSHPQR
jgi:radical SAM superfamily enzyme YgiQ (UPF0313 family)